MSATHQPRIAVNEAAELTRPDEAVILCTIVDVSAAGFRVRSSDVIRCGPAILRINSGEHAVDVRWASMGEAGGLFV